MPQFALDGIFAPLSLTPAAPQRLPSVSVDDAMFNEHLARASQPPVAPSSDRTSPSSKFPECTTQPVQPSQRCSESTRDSESNERDRKTHHAESSSQPRKDERATQSGSSQSTRGDSKEETTTEVAGDRPEEANVDNEAEAASAALADSSLQMATTNANIELTSAVEAADGEASQEAVDPELARGRKAVAKTNIDAAAAPAAAAARKDTSTQAHQTVAKGADANSEHKAAAGAALAANDMDDASQESMATHLEIDAEQTVQDSSEPEAASLNKGVAAAKPAPVDTAPVGRVETPLDDETRKQPLAQPMAEGESARPAPQPRRRETRDERAAANANTTKSTTQGEPVAQPTRTAPVENSERVDTLAATADSRQDDRVAPVDPTANDSAPDTPEARTSGSVAHKQHGDATHDLSNNQHSRLGATQVRQGDSGASPSQAQMLSDVERFRIVQRVARAISTSTTSLDGGQMRLRLSPPELGSLRMEIVVRQGNVTAHVEAETAAAREVLLDNLPALRERLAEQNIRLERFDVDLMRQSLDRSPQHAGSQDSDRGAGERQANRTATRNAPESVERATVSAPIVQDGHVNIVI